MRKQVREFLTSRRGRLTPGQVSLAVTGGRRVPRLRRSEVATLAGSGGDPLVAELTEDDIAWMASEANLPVLVKGVLHPPSARHLLDLGAAGLVVSNHGGHFLDSGVPAVSALPGIREAVGPDVPVLLDSGVRSGSDVVKALALGADAVLVGRPCLLGLTVGGSSGEEAVLSALVTELLITLSNVGARSVEDLDPSFVIMG